MISQSRYIKIVSGVGAGASVAQRQLILRLITQNSTLPPGIVAQFSTAAAVGAYFGLNSEEYKRSLAYFAFISKNTKSPALISFARWVSASIPPMIIGDALPKVLSSFSGVNAGTLTLNNGNTAIPIVGINLSTATSMTQVASMIQTALIANLDPSLKTDSTVTWNSNTNQFVLTGASALIGSGAITATATGTANDISQLLGWATGGTVFVAGQTADTAQGAVAKSAGISNNFGSFVYCTPSAPMANTDIAAVASWNDAQNNMYIYSVAVALSNLQTLFALVTGFSGCALNVLSTTQANDYVEQSPCEILAATDYTAVNATQNYMYYQFAARNTTVSDDATANTCDAARGNYIGVTQNAGQQLAFYQRGVLCGGSQAAVDMNTYANEMWLKSAVASTLMALFLAVGRVPANITGQAMILAVMQSIIDTAKNNGTISAGKTISIVQQQYITQVSGDPGAWRQIANIGYWINVTFSSYVNTNSGLTEWQANYTLLYAKDDAIRLVNGSDTMI